MEGRITGPPSLTAVAPLVCSPLSRPDRKYHAIWRQRALSSDEIYRPTYTASRKNKYSTRFAVFNVFCRSDFCSAVGL